MKIFFAFILMFVGNEALETTKVIELTHAVSKATYLYLSVQDLVQDALTIIQKNKRLCATNAVKREVIGRS